MANTEVIVGPKSNDGSKQNRNDEKLLAGMSKPKEPWQMTKAEYESLHGAARGNTTVSGRFSQHKSAVEIALNRGLPVPPEVLADYPSLSSPD